MTFRLSGPDEIITSAIGGAYGFCANEWWGNDAPETAITRTPFVKGPGRELPGDTQD